MKYVTITYPFDGIFKVKNIPKTLKGKTRLRKLDEANIFPGVMLRLCAESITVIRAVVAHDTTGNEYWKVE